MIYSDFSNFVCNRVCYFTVQELIRLDSRTLGPVPVNVLGLLVVSNNIDIKRQIWVKGHPRSLKVTLFNR